MRILGGILLTALALTGSALATNASATFPGKPGPMMITEGRDILAIDPRSGESRKVLEAGNVNYAPTITSDGRHFLYLGGEFETNSIFIRALANTNQNYPGRAILTRPQRDNPRALGMRTLDVSPGQGRIVFAAVVGGYSRKPSHQIEIYSVRRDGKGLRRLTRNRMFDNDPAVSPDGSKIVFARRSGGDASIWIMNSDGSGQKRLTRSPGWERQPSFSPDGRRIIYSGQVKREGLDRWQSAELFTMSARDGRHRTRLTRNQSFELLSAFSPSGKSVAYIRDYGQYDLKILDLETRETRLVYRAVYGGGITSLTWGPATE